ncbi:MAG: Fic family protein [Candidatus Micrarchaeota archaeon]
MARIAKRIVKGKPYYYLEESFLQAGKTVTESEYLGSAIPDSETLRKIFSEFKSKLERKGIRHIIPPFTEFVTRNLSSKLARAVESKAKYLKSLSPQKRAEFIHRERITFITESNAIEGSTLDYGLTDRVVSDQKRIERLQKQGYTITGMDREEQEALNLNKCLEHYEILLAKNAELSEELILRLHLTLLSKIKGYEKYAGVWRPVNVMIRGSNHVFPEHAQVPSLMKELLEWYRSNDGLIQQVELAAKIHTKFTTVHPFADGNGRMARLLMNYVLQAHGFPFTNIPLSRRAKYMKTQAAGNENDQKPFTLFLAEEIIRQNQNLRKK